MTHDPKHSGVDNRRVFFRLSKSLPVRYRLVKNSKSPKAEVSPVEMCTNTKDISAGGLAFYIKENIPPQSLVEVTLQLPDQKEPIVCLAEVVRSRIVEHTYFRDTALNFLDLSSHDRQVLDKFVKKEASDHA